jgi:tRNA modification GTPase
MFSLDDTIAAISTPIGEGGIGIVRMTGPEAAEILEKLFVPTSANRPSGMEPRTLHYGHIQDHRTGEFVDEVLAVYMPAPHTFTRQDVVEIDGHGGIVALQRILGLCLGEGARLAGPGEFTARAFLNGRLDLAQAEAVLDVVRAKTEASLRMAVGQLGGGLSDHIRAVRAGLLDALAYLEASIDFAEDEIPERDIGSDLERAQFGLSRLIDDAERGIIYRQGVRAAIVGRPNVGKSSLLNRLLRTNRAIVTDVPGTTRDTLEETLSLQGIPVVLVDTAGISVKTEDLVERLGIERSQAALAQADLALMVVDASQPPTEADRSIAALLDGRPAIAVLNKVDLLDNASRTRLPFPFDALCSSCVPISALTGEGLDKLEETMVATVLSGRVLASEAPAVANPRHKEALSRALAHVNAAYLAYENNVVADLICIDLTAAVNALGEITGQTASEDLIEAIFGNFCIGK